MQDAASVLTDRFSDVLERLPAGLDLDGLAVEAKAIQRRREVVDGAACCESRLHAVLAGFLRGRLPPGRPCRGSPNSAIRASNTGWLGRGGVGARLPGAVR